MSLRKIAEEVGCAVNTARSHLKADTLPKYERTKLRVTKLSAFEEYLRERQAAARPAWIPATVLLREIVALGYPGSHSQLRAYMHGLRPTLPVPFETAPGEQMQVDWVEFRKGRNPLYAFCATLGFSRASFVEFVTDMKVETLIACHQHAFDAFGGITKRVLYDNMKTVVIERCRWRRRASLPRRISRFRPPLRLRDQAVSTVSGQDQGQGRALQRLFAPLVLRAAGGAAQTGRADTGCSGCQCPGTSLAKRHRQRARSWHDANSPRPTLTRRMFAADTQPLAWRHPCGASPA